MQPLSALLSLAAAAALGGCGDRAVLLSDEPSSYGPYDLYALIVWSSDDDSGPVEGLAMVSQTRVSMRYAGPLDIDRCWLSDGVDLPGQAVDIGESIGIQVGSTQAQFVHTIEGDPFYYLLAEGDVADGLSGSGRELVVGGSVTGLSTPERLSGISGVSDPSGLVQLTWDPPTTTSEDQVIVVILDTPAYEDVFCSLEDDGAAELDLAGLELKLTAVVFRSVSGLPDLGDLGTGYVTMLTGRSVLLTETTP